MKRWDAICAIGDAATEELSKDAAPFWAEKAMTVDDWQRVRERVNAMVVLNLGALEAKEKANGTGNNS